VLPADGGDQALVQEVRARSGQRPASPGQAQVGRGLIGPTPNGSPVSAREAGACAHAALLAERGHALALKGVPVRIRGVDMDLQEPSNVRGVVPGGGQ